MTTPLFLDDSSRPKLESLLIGVSGAHNGYRSLEYTQEISADVDVKTPGIYDPATARTVVNTMSYNALAIWKDFEYAFVPGPACFGRIVTLHTGWIAPGCAEPTTEAEFRVLPGYTVSVVGGVGDPQFNRAWSRAPFSSVRHRVISSNNLKITSAMKLCWFLSHTDVSAASNNVKGAGAFFFLRILGTYDVYGETT